MEPETTAPGPTPEAATTETVRASILRKSVPLVLLAGLAAGNAWFFERDLATRQELRDVTSRKKDADERAAEAEKREKETAEELAARRADVEHAKLALAEAERMGGDRLALAKRDLEKAERRAAELADRLGETKAKLDETQAAREAAEAHARELDAVIEALKKKKINARRLAGLESPPRLEIEVVSTDERNVPPVLILRLEDGSTGIEEGDILYISRTKDGHAQETGRAVIERVDLEKRLVSARVSRLDPGEKVGVGDRLATYPPGK